MWLEEREVMRHLVALEPRLLAAAAKVKMDRYNFHYAVGLCSFPPVLSVLRKSSRPFDYGLVSVDIDAFRGSPCFPAHKSERGIVRSAGRASPCGIDSLRTSWDDVDEILYRLNKSKIGRPCDWTGKTLQRFACEMRCAVQNVMLDKAKLSESGKRYRLCHFNSF